MSEFSWIKSSEVRELVCRAQKLVDRAPVMHKHTAYPHKEYKVGKIIIVLDHGYGENQLARTNLYIEYDCFETEKVDVLTVYQVGGYDITERGRIDYNANRNQIRYVLGEIRAHMLLDDLANV